MRRRGDGEMSNLVTIVEIRGRAEQGITKPFLCRADDGHFYYVKGRNAGLRSLCCEWIAGNLAQRFGLRIPPFLVAEVPSELVTSSARDDIWELGSGLVFASQKVENAAEITWTEAMALPEHAKAEILFFDRWVRNDDRSLSALGGNPNMLMANVDDDARGAWIFDFNLAFDSRFDVDVFWMGHVFADLLPHWPEGFREEAERRATAALGSLPAIIGEMPLEWLHMEGDENLPVQLDLDLVRASLAEGTADTFWSRK